MRTLPFENPKIKKNKTRLEKALKVKIDIKGEDISIDGKPEDEYIAEKVIEAMDFGFPLQQALQIKERDFLFEIINIKDHTKKRDFHRIKARIIGKDGRALKTLSILTNCDLKIKNHFVGIIGPPECIHSSQEAIISIIKGSKHSNVYKFLETNQVKPISDFDLKEK